jgi:hypothetical protein
MNPNTNPNRLCGVFVVALRRKHVGPRLRTGQYFPTTLAASQHLGYRSDIVARHLQLSFDDGVARVGGVYFKTAKQIYIDWKRSGWTSHAPWLIKQFPFVRERRIDLRELRPRVENKVSLAVAAGNGPAPEYEI